MTVAHLLHGLLSFVYYNYLPSYDFWPNRQRNFKRLAARWHSPAALDLEGKIDALYNDPCQLALRKDYPFGYARKI